MTTMPTTEELTALERLAERLFKGKAFPDTVRSVDTAFAIVRRATSRSSLATADKGHLHHRLMNLGHGHRRSVLILWTWTALLSAFVLYPILTDQNPEYLPFGMAALAPTYSHSLALRASVSAARVWPGRADP